jgi:hypothetical protein
VADVIWIGKGVDPSSGFVELLVNDRVGVLLMDTEGLLEEPASL